MTEGDARAAQAGLRYRFAGEAAPQEVWVALSSDPHAMLLDVRTDAEWAFVGAPDLSRLSKDVWLLPWRVFPGMARNEGFVEALGEKIAESGATTIFVICRSGARSLEAANLAAETLETKSASALEEERGQATVSFVNVKEGFEGDLNEERHRGQKNGWKARGLPWVQG
ncbi:MAG: rhodanese-like domain-containing protein [Neomegalonema sp.]|nr:rhodanese-like domain-containing protein [Neomegalonema sp.]